MAFSVKQRLDLLRLTMNTSDLFSYRVIRSNLLVEAIEYELSFFLKLDQTCM